MTAMLIISYLFSFILELLIFSTFFSIFSKRKELNQIHSVLIMLAFCLAGTLLKQFVINQIVYSLCIFIMFYTYSLRYELKASKRFYLVCFNFMISILSEVAFTLIVTAIYGISVDEMQTNFVIFIQCLLTAKLALFAFVRVLKQFIKTSLGEMPKITIPAYIILPLSTFFSLYALSDIVYYTDSSVKKFVVFLSAILLISSNLIVFFILDYIAKQKAKEQIAQAQALQLEYEKQHYIALYEKQTLSNKTVHDLKNTMFGFQALLDTNIDDAKTQIDHICKNLQAVSQLKITNISALDALISAKKQECADKNIVLNIASYISEIVGFNIIDLCIILGNLLDNSIEAAEKLPPERDKTIQLEIKKNRNFLIFTITNPCEENINSRSFKTNKPEKHLHGFGIKNVKELAQKYNGEFNLIIKDAQAIASVFLVENVEKSL